MQRQCATCGTPSEAAATCEVCRTSFELTGVLGGVPPPSEEPLPPEAEVASQIPQNRFGRYVRVALLGKGGMGEVYKAWDVELHRWVALKFPRLEDPEELERLRREASSAGRLSHPNVAAVYEFAQAQGRHFIAMQYVSGKTLADCRNLDPKKATAWIRAAARGVGQAHRQGIVHRDLKPANLMVERDHVYVMDFGLARAIAAGRTQTGVVGTPAYMSPEQASGRRVGTASDVYSLGATLYELLAGRPPFEGKGVAEILYKIVNEEARPVKEVDRDLSTILMKCLEKDPERRYTTADELAEDLVRWSEGEAIQARPPSAAYRWGKKLRKRRAVVGAGLVGLIAVGVVLAILLPKLGKEKKAKSQVERNLELWQKVSPLLSEAEMLARAGEMARARSRLEEGLDQCRPHADHADGRYFTGRLLRELGRRREAEKELDRAIEMNPRMGEARFERGLLLVEEYDARKRLYRFAPGVDFEDEISVETRHPDLRDLRTRAIEDLSAERGTSTYYREADALYGQAELLRVNGRGDEAKRLLERILEQDPAYVSALACLAKISIVKGAWEEATARATRAVEIHRGCRDGYAVRAMASWLQGRSSLEDAEAMVRLEPMAFDSYVFRALARERWGDQRGAIEDFTRALAIRPDHAYSYNCRGALRIRTQELPAALHDFDKALDLDPTCLDAWVNRGSLRSMQRDWERAFQDFDEALRLCPESAEVYYNRALAEEERGNRESALRDYTRALERNPRLKVALENRAGIRSETGDALGAIEDYSKALAVDSRSATAYYGRALVYFREGKSEEAIQDYTKALEFEPGFAEAYANRAAAKMLKEDWKGAAEDCAKALEIDPRHVAAYRIQGILAESRGRTEEAIERFSKAIESDPGNADLYVDRGAAYEKNGDLEKAKADYERALEIVPGHRTARAALDRLKT